MVLFDFDLSGFGVPLGTVMDVIPVAAPLLVDIAGFTGGMIVAEKVGFVEFAIEEHLQCAFGDAATGHAVIGFRVDSLDEYINHFRTKIGSIGGQFLDVFVLGIHVVFQRPQKVESENLVLEQEDTQVDRGGQDGKLQQGLFADLRHLQVTARMVPQRPFH